MNRKIFAGGAVQIILPRVSRDEMDQWVLGYRRIGARRLTKIPAYPFTSVDEVVKSINLYPIFCPECQCSDIHKVDFYNPKKSIKRKSCPAKCLQHSIDFIHKIV